MSLPVSYPFFKARYDMIFGLMASQTPISPEALLKIAFDLTGDSPKMLKNNNPFAIHSKGTPAKYSTIFIGVAHGISAITQNPSFGALKIGTLKANSQLQYIRLKSMLKIS